LTSRNTRARLIRAAMGFSAVRSAQVVVIWVGERFLWKRIDVLSLLARRARNRDAGRQILGSVRHASCVRAFRGDGDREPLMG